jgi:hypothetical protein
VVLGKYSIFYSASLYTQTALADSGYSIRLVKVSPKRSTNLVVGITAKYKLAAADKGSESACHWYLRDTPIRPVRSLSNTRMLQIRQSQDRFGRGAFPYVRLLFSRQLNREKTLMKAAHRHFGVARKETAFLEAMHLAQ